MGKHPHIVAHWEVTGRGAGRDLSFPLGGVQYQRGDAPARTAISASSCSTALRRKRLAVRPKRYFTDVSYVYELTAPMVTVVDMTERDRTEQLSRR